MTVYEFISNQPETELVLINCEYDTYKFTIADLKKAATENKNYIVDFYTWSNDFERWEFCCNGNMELPDEINSEYLYIRIHDNRL